MIPLFNELSLNGATLIASEIGSVDGLTYRERYRLTDGSYIDVRRDLRKHHAVINWTTFQSARKNRPWQIPNG